MHYARVAALKTDGEGIEVLREGCAPLRVGRILEIMRRPQVDADLFIVAKRFDLPDRFHAAMIQRYACFCATLNTL